MLLMVLLVSCGIGVLCWVVLLVIVILLSGKVIRPITYGIEVRTSRKTSGPDFIIYL